MKDRKQLLINDDFKKNFVTYDINFYKQSISGNIINLSYFRDTTIGNIKNVTGISYSPIDIQSPGIGLINKIKIPTLELKNLTVYNETNIGLYLRNKVGRDSRVSYELDLGLLSSIELFNFSAVQFYLDNNIITTNYEGSNIAYVQTIGIQFLISRYIIKFGTNPSDFMDIQINFSVNF